MSTRLSAPFKALISYWDRHQRVFGLGALVVGFLFDLWIARRPDSLANNTLLLSYLFIAGAIIVLLNIRERRIRRSAGGVPPEPLLLLLILQFCFGGLASNMLILYGKSGTFAASLLFVGVLLAMAVGNEFLRNRYALLRFNVAVYYLLLLTYSTITVPTFILHYIGGVAFLISGLLSILVAAIFLALLWLVIARDERPALFDAGGIVLGIFLAFSGLYYLNLIPPVPLSLKDAGVYHSVVRSGTNAYAVSFEAPRWFEPWRDTSGIFHVTAGETAYCWSAVFAPVGLSAAVYHRWERYDMASHTWETRTRIPFSISGGREAGYRGYPALSPLAAGDWRCRVETASGSLIGQVSFKVETSPTPPALRQVVL